ncbi:hypothetical protein [Streptomyces sp. DH37]|uniref:hypothetical protein n=1 Tax=Streptomyces sp. DH37 TaxID=3040122 RepID=UPI0024413403|nr:hypothetical protein [Streptomyces sp. DH37]MDG9705532.1 hypothetical protein [Streptomyces sp. DH37]
MSQATHPPRCIACRAETRVPTPLHVVDSASGPPRAPVICLPCARERLAHHRHACATCLSGVDCAAASGAKQLIRMAGRRAGAVR